MEIDLELGEAQIKELVNMTIEGKSNRELFLAVIIEICKLRARIRQLEIEE